MGKSIKNINIEVSIECWKYLKILSIQRDGTLQDVVQEILERESRKGSVVEMRKEK